MWCFVALIITAVLPKIFGHDDEFTTPSKPRVFSHYGKHYFLSTKEFEGDYYNSDYECRRLGFVLGTAKDAKAQARLVSFLQSTDIGWLPVWLGGTDSGSYQDINQQPRFWHWYTNSELFTYTNWNHSRPTAGWKANSCLVIDMRTAHWIDYICHNYKYRFVCEIK